MVNAGDTQGIWKYIIILVIALMVIIGKIVLNKRNKK